MMTPLLHRLIRTAAWLAVPILAVAWSLPLLAQRQLPPIPFSPNDHGPDPTKSRENLQDLGLESSHLVPVQPIPGGTVATADYIRELYQVQWRDADPIEIYVIRPKGVSKPPVSIYLYGYPVDPERFRNDAFCKLVTRGGIAAIGFMPALTGQRYHDVPLRTWFVSDLHDSMVRTVHDVQMIVNYAQSRNDLDASRVAIFGQGAGATIAGLAALTDPRITAVDLLDPWGDWPRWFADSSLVPDRERPDFLKPEFLQALSPLDPVNWLPRLSGKRLKLDHALYERGTPLEAKQKIEAALPATARLARYSTKADFDELAVNDGKLLDWMQEELRSRSSQQAHSFVSTAHDLSRAANQRP